jgi:hypothetical protein
MGANRALAVETVLFKHSISNLYMEQGHHGDRDGTRASFVARRDFSGSPSSQQWYLQNTGIKSVAGNDFVRIINTKTGLAVNDNTPLAQLLFGGNSGDVALWGRSTQALGPVGYTEPVYPFGAFITPSGSDTSQPGYSDQTQNWEMVAVDADSNRYLFRNMGTGNSLTQWDHGTSDDQRTASWPGFNPPLNGEIWILEPAGEVNLTKVTLVEVQCIQTSTGMIEGVEELFKGLDLLMDIGFALYTGGGLQNIADDLGKGIGTLTRPLIRSARGKIAGKEIITAAAMDVKDRLEDNGEESTVEDRLEDAILDAQLSAATGDPAGVAWAAGKAGAIELLNLFSGGNYETVSGALIGFITGGDTPDDLFISINGVSVWPDGGLGDTEIETKEKIDLWGLDHFVATERGLNIKLIEADLGGFFGSDDDDLGEISLTEDDLQLLTSSTNLSDRVAWETRVVKDSEGSEYTLTFRIEPDPGTQLRIPIGSEQVEVSPAAAAYKVPVESGTQWYWESDVAWLTSAEPETLYNNNEFDYTAAENQTDSPRIGTLTFYSGAISTTIEITQLGLTTRAQMRWPLSDSTIYGDSQMFSWTSASGNNLTKLKVGTTPNGRELYFQADGTNDQSVSVSGLPGDGSKIYVSLLSEDLNGGGYVVTQYEYTSRSYTRFTLSDDFEEVSYLSKAYGLTVNSNVPWRWESDVPWLSSNTYYDESQSEQIFDYTLQVNPGATPRVGTLKFRPLGGSSQTFVVRQGASTVEVNAIPRIGSGAASFETPMSLEGNWTWESDAAWLTSSEADSQNGDQTFSYSAATNSGNDERTNTLRFYSVNSRELLSTLTVVQQPGMVRNDEPKDNEPERATEIQISSAGLDHPEAFGNIGESGDRDYYKITNSDNHDYIHVRFRVNEPSGPASGQLKIYGGTTVDNRLVSAETNTINDNGTNFDQDGETTKTATYTIDASDGETYLICLEENGGLEISDYQLFVEGTSAVFSKKFKGVNKEGETYTIPVTAKAGQEWSVTGNPSWVNATPMNGTGSGSVQITVEPTPVGDLKRETSLNIGGISHVLKQKWNPILEASDNDAPEEAQLLLLKTNGESLNVEGEVRNSSDRDYFKIETGDIDYASIKIEYLMPSPGNNRHRVTVLAGDGTTVLFEEVNENFNSANGSIGRVSPFTIDRPDKNTVYYVEIESSEYSDRRDYLLSITGTLAHPAPPLFTSTPKTITSREQEYYIFVNTDEPWSAATDQPWVTLDQTSGTNSDVITVSLAANPGASDRTANITINGIEQQLTQAEFIATNCTLSLIDDQVEIGFSGILQSSSDLHIWEDVDPQPTSPYRFAPNTAPGMFFKARAQ